MMLGWLSLSLFHSVNLSFFLSLSWRFCRWRKMITRGKRRRREKERIQRKSSFSFLLSPHVFLTQQQKLLLSCLLSCCCLRRTSFLRCTYTPARQKQMTLAQTLSQRNNIKTRSLPVIHTSVSSPQLLLFLFKSSYEEGQRTQREKRKQQEFVVSWSFVHFEE